MRGIKRFFAILFLRGRKFKRSDKSHSGLVEILNPDKKTFHFEPFLFTSAGKVILKEGDLICRLFGKKFVLDKDGFINKNVVKG